MYIYIYISGQITIIPKPELRGFWGDSLTKPPFGVTSAEVAIIYPDIYIYNIHIYIYVCVCLMTSDHNAQVIHTSQCRTRYVHIDIIHIY